MILAVVLLAAASAAALVCVLAAARSKDEADALDAYLEATGGESGFLRAAELVALQKRCERSPALRPHSEGSLPG